MIPKLLASQLGVPLMGSHPPLLSKGLPCFQLLLPQPAQTHTINSQ